jgi:hypothetical protein
MQTLAGMHSGIAGNVPGVLLFGAQKNVKKKGRQKRRNEKT